MTRYVVDVEVREDASVVAWGVDEVEADSPEDALLKVGINLHNVES